MREKFVYVDHLGRKFDGLENGVYLNYNDLRDYAWHYDTINNRISRFYRSITKRNIPLVVVCGSAAEAITVKNRLFDLAEADIRARMPGRIYIGDYYTLGYITSSTKADYLITKQYCTITLQLTSENPAWYSEHTHGFMPGSNDIGDSISGGTDYPYDYPYDYALSMSGRRITCDTIADNAFRLRIYGSAVNPTITVGGHVYTVNGTIGEGESLLIDSTTKTIILTTASGQNINWFDKRGRDYYIFQPIPPGQHTVSWTGTFGFDLTVIEERSEPRWT